MASGRYDHPSYLARHVLALGATTAGANGTSLQFAFPVDVNVRNITATVRTAGTATTHILTIQSGTTSIGAVTLSTNTAGQTGTTGDLNTKVTAGTVLNIKNGADATGVAAVAVEWEIPKGSTWS